MSTIASPDHWQELFAQRTAASSSEALIAIMGLANATDLVSFAGGYPDPSTFPRSELPQILEELLADSGDSTPLQYSPVEGLASTRDYVASRIDRNEGTRPKDDELIITSGGIEALELLSKVFLDRGDVVLVEAPTYLGAIMAFQGFEAQIATVRLDENGLVVDELNRIIEGGLKPKLLYTVSDHQNPSGVSLSAERRRELVALAQKSGFLIIEDVAYRELGFDEATPPSLWTLCPDVVLQIGTFSKTFFPGVRLGWAVGPSPVVSKLVWAKQNTDQGAGALGQRLLESYGRRGLLDEQCARARALYERRCGLLLGALAEYMPDDTTWTQPRGGFFTWVTVGAWADTVELADQARDARVAFVPGAPFFPDGRGRSNLRLSFSRVDDSDIEVGVTRLANLLRVQQAAARS